MKPAKTLCLGLLLAAPALSLHAQKAMTVDDLVSWKHISQQTISNDGAWAACVFSPWKGDSEAQVYATDGHQTAVYPLGTDTRFSAGSGYVLVKEAPAVKDVEALKLKKTKKDKLPMDRLHIRRLADGIEWTIDSLKSYRLAESADWLAYQSGRKDSVLHLTSLDRTQQFTLPNVSAYGFAKEGATLYYVTPDSTADTRPGLYVWTAGAAAPTLVKAGNGRFRQPAFDESGQRLAFLYTGKEDRNTTEMSLWMAQDGQPARCLADRRHPGMTAGWIISPHRELTFSKDGRRLFFGTAPQPLQKDTTVLAENRPNVQVWSGDEPVQYTVQQYNKEKDLKKAYTAVWMAAESRMVQLADSLRPDATLNRQGQGDYVLVSTSRPYSLSSMWEGRSRSDWYRVSLKDGSRTALSRADYARYHLSPAGKYAYAYNETDSCWYTIELASGTRYRLTTPQTFAAWDEDTDVPDYPRAHGVAGWSEGDERLLLYDRYDIWSFSPTASGSPVRLTTDGRENRRSYRLLTLDPDQESVRLKEPQYLRSFDEGTKAHSFYTARLDRPGRPALLCGSDDRLFGLPLKAKNAGRVLFTQENFQTFPDLYSADLRFAQPVRLTHGGDQQEGFIWGSAELVEWTSFDGTPLQGVVYKPSDFDPHRQYPMIVNFYERNSETLNKYRMPEAHRSTIDYHYYLSNGYIIFNPDVRYSRDGFPGEDCYNCVMPGIAAVVAKGYVDHRRIGAQGHSWGGYQVAYLATRTNLFAAIESGAPVVNMFSAYGGIRWGSGLNRSFQYEHTQSRIGGTPWDATTRYFENSPLFFMDKVHTPILIMHNDADGHVPWYQGIEYFIALKRLQRPVWMLNYVGEPHWPLNKANQKDFQIRMFQFFAHYLKGEPMPKWMEEGVPAVKQPFELGY